MDKLAWETLAPADRQLITAAMDIRRRAYAPYSQYLVGAALLDETGRMFCGCNVEGADYTLTTHAEISAINAMIAAGSHRVRAIAVVVRSSVGYGMPCGLCRQRLREFAAEPRLRVVGVNLDAHDAIRDLFAATLDELLPYSFGPDFLAAEAVR